MPEMTPVANQVQPPDPMRGVNTFSALLGIKQQQQALQTGQYLQQSAQANASQDQQKNNELQRAAQVAQSAGNYRTPTGDFDRQKMANDIAAIGPYAQQHASSLLSQANEIIANQKAHQELTASQQQRAGAAFGALANKPDLSNSDFIDTADALVEQGLVPRRMAMSMLTHMPPNATPQQLQQLAQRWSISATSPEAAAGTTMPVLGSQFGPGGNLVGTAQNRVTGALSSPQQQQGVQVGLGPTDKPGYRGAVAAATAAAGEYAGGASKADVQRANDVRSAATDAGRTIQLTKQIDDLFDAIDSGKIAEAASHGLKYLGFASVAEARATLEKDLGQIKGPLATRAGSDSRAADVLQGYPDSSTPAHTAHAAMDQVRGLARQDQARYQNLQKTGNPGFQDRDTAFTSKSNPLMHEYMALKPEERAAFYRRNFTSAKEAQQFKDSVKQFQGSGP